MRKKKHGTMLANARKEAFNNRMMQHSLITERYREFKHDLFLWRCNSGISAKLLASLMMSCLTGIMAQIVWYLPWTPVPVTGQTFAVLLAGLVLGRWGSASQVMYVGIGIAGVPWFAGAQGGTGVLAGPTFGYLLGFILAAYLIGYATEDWPAMRRFVPLTILMIVVNIVIILGLGTVYLSLWLRAAKGTSTGLVHLLYMSAAPFIPGGLVKSCLAAFIGTAIMPIQKKTNR